VLLHKLEQVVRIAIALVLDGRATAGRRHVQRGEALHVKLVRRIVDGRVELCNDEVLLVGELLGELGELRLELLAMAAPCQSIINQ